MTSLGLFLLSLGAILLLGLLTSTLGGRTVLPRVTLLILLGVALGEQGVNVLPAAFSAHFDVIAQITLMMVGFLLGGKLGKDTLRKSAKTVIFISVGAALTSALIVAAGLVWFGVESNLAILLGAISAATAPAAIVDVVNESGRSNKFTDSLLSIVALDDVWALLLFATSMAFVANLIPVAGESSFLLDAGVEILGAVALGIVLGIPTAYLSGRIRDGEPMLLEALGAVFICGGLALWLDLSYLISTIVLGAVVTNLATHHERPFHAIKDIESLFLVVFFVAAGASLELTLLRSVGMLGIAYIVLRCAGKYLGAWLGARLAKADESIAHWMRYALLPQAGVSIGMALVAATHFPEYHQTVLALVIGSTVFFEIVGPVYTRLAIHRASEEQT